MPDFPVSLGKYQILERVGQGGMGEVYRAFDPDLRRHVAIKTLLPRRRDGSEFRERFLREARVAAGLDHPNIVRIHDMGVEEEIHYLVMEYVEGMTLDDRLARGRPDPEEALHIAYTVARAIHYAHERKIIHRDIKPSNLIVDGEGRVRILDFGLAKSFLDRDLTTSGDVVGTPRYMAPERLIGDPDLVDGRADIYSLGAVLYEMLTGRPPFDEGGGRTLFERILGEDPAPPGISPEVDFLVLKALAKKTDRRYATAGGMAEAIKSCIDHSSTFRRVRNPPTPAPAGPSTIPSASAAVPVPGRRRTVLAVAAAILLAGGVLLTRILPGRDAGREVNDLLARHDYAHALALLERSPDPESIVLRLNLHLKLGQYGRAALLVDGYERAVYALASGRTLQRFVSPELFPLRLEEMRGIANGPAFLISAVHHHFLGNRITAREKWKAASAAGAPVAHVALVRAHLDLTDAVLSPEGAAEREILREVRAELARHDALFLPPLHALAWRMEGSAPAAWAVADRLLTSAPHAAETYLLRALLFQSDGRIAEAQDVLDDVQRLDPGLDTSLHRLYLKWLAIIDDPRHNQPGAGVWRVIRHQLDERIAAEPHPMALYLRGVLHALESRWTEAQADFQAIDRTVRAERIRVGRVQLQAFAGPGIAKLSHILAAARDLQDHLGRREDALATAARITGEDLQEEARAGFLRENALRIARMSGTSDLDRTLRAVRQAVDLGASPQSLREDPALGELREREEFRALLRTFERK